MKRYILFKSGILIHTDLSKVGLNWIKVNNVYTSHITREEKQFLEKYGLRPSIFNVANLRKFGKIVIPDAIAQKIITEQNIPVERL